MSDRPKYNKWRRKAGGQKVCRACNHRHAPVMRVDGKPTRVKQCVKCGAALPRRLTYPKRAVTEWFVREADPCTGRTKDVACRSSEHADQVIREKQRDFTPDPIQSRLIEHASHLIRQIDVADFNDAVNELIEQLGGSAVDRKLKFVTWYDAVQTICRELRDKGMSGDYVDNIVRVCEFVRVITGAASWSSLTLDHIAKYRSQRLAGGWTWNKRKMRAVGAYAINGDLRTLSAFLSRAVKKRWIASNILDGAQDEFIKTRSIRVRYMPDSDLRKLLEGVAGTWFESFLILAYYTAARRSDLLALQWDDVDLDGSKVAPEGRTGPHIYIRGNKSDMPHWLPLHADAVASIESLRKQPSIDQKLFPVRGSRNPKSYVSRRFANLCIETGLTVEVVGREDGALKNRWKLHDLRRKSNTDLRNGGASVKERAALLGQRSTSVNEQFYEATQVQRERALIDALPCFGKTG